MTGMYDNIIPNTNYNLEIDGMPFYIDDYQINEGTPRREMNETQIALGTPFVSRGKYVVREGTFYSTVLVERDHHDVHYPIFKRLNSKPCEVYCPLLGGIFTAQVIIKWEKDTPTSLRLSIYIKEITTGKSEIPGEEHIENLDTFVVKNGG
ncbi:MAG: hypothetical protein K6A34_06105 [Methanobrevibacter sp.]|nr:hypothetical protein [Methanobrevibacter sp.]